MVALRGEVRGRERIYSGAARHSWRRGSAAKPHSGRDSGGPGNESAREAVNFFFFCSCVFFANNQPSGCRRHDFYQTPTSVIASFFLKKIDKDKAKVEFQPQQLVLDLPTADAKRYRAEVPLYGPIDAAKSTFKILGTKLEVTLAKADGSSWPVLRSDDRLTGEIIQIGRAGRA